MKTTIGRYLLERLKEIGINHVIGVPGDFNLRFLEQIEEEDDIEFVGTCNELNAAYAVDAYARQSGCGALLTTYGVGELSALCGVAGAYAEQVPFIAITGAPPLFAMEQGLALHHSLADGNFDNMMQSYKPFTAAQTRITPQNAANEIDRVLSIAITEKRPVYLQLPSDISHIEIEANSGKIALRKNNNFANLEQALEQILVLWQKATRPAILIDKAAHRLGLQAILDKIIIKGDIAFASLLTSKSILNEAHPKFAGMYNGAASQPAPKQRVEEADFLLAIDPVFIEVNSGSFSHNLPENTIIIANHCVKIGEKIYDNVEARDILLAFLSRIDHHQPQKINDHHHSFAIKPQEKLTQARLWSQIAQILTSGDTVIAESGTSSIGLNGQKFNGDIHYMTTPIWGAIGYTLPATLGSCLANPNSRHFLFIGDGSFQMTAQELSTLIREDCKPIIFLLNNKGYTIERYIWGMEDKYNDVANWDYAALPAVFGQKDKCFIARVKTEGELQQAYEDACLSGKLAFIEMALDPFDAPDSLKAFGPMTAQFDYGIPAHLAQQKNLTK